MNRKKQKQTRQQKIGLAKKTKTPKVSSGYAKKMMLQVKGIFGDKSPFADKQYKVSTEQ